MLPTSALDRLVEGVPPYDAFLTLEELERQTRELAAAHPGAVELLELGRTRAGRPLTCIRVGDGPCRVVACGVPHPNEPVGAMTLTHLAGALAASPELVGRLGCTWYVLKAWDADGLVLNEGWLKGPFTLHGYARHYFRPTFADQPDWTFPVTHKGLSFDAPTPEAACVMRLVDEVRPHVVLSLHNCSFGGAYWYETEPTPGIWEGLLAAARRRGIPLNLATPEMPYARLLAPGVFQTLGAEAEYDYYEGLGCEDPAALVTHGTTSASYAARRYGSFGLVCEIPYFLDPAIEDGGGCGRSLREVTLERLDAVGECGELVAGWMGRLGDAVRADSPYRAPLTTATFAASDGALRRQALSDDSFLREATVAEEFEACVVRPFYRARNVGMLLSALDYERARRALGAGESEVVAEVAGEAEEWLLRACEGFEARSSYRAAPISDLVATQVESVLLAVGHVRASRGL